MFWSRYVALCEKKGKAPNVVAAEVGVKSSGTVTGWKNGAKPRDTVLQRLSTYFGVTVEDLTGEKKKSPPPHPETSLKKSLLLGEMERKLNGLIQKIKWTHSEKSLMLCHLSTTKRYLMVR